MTEINSFGAEYLDKLAADELKNSDLKDKPKNSRCMSKLQRKDTRT